MYEEITSRKKLEDLFTKETFESAYAKAYERFK